MEVSNQLHAPAALLPWERANSDLCIGGQEDSEARWDETLEDNKYPSPLLQKEKVQRAALYCFVLMLLKPS